jgi:hypothetical protein
VTVERVRLTVRAEISVMAYGTLVSVTANVTAMTFVFAEWTVTGDAKVNFGAGICLLDALIDWDEAVSRVDVDCTEVAVRAEVPIWALKTLVANSMNGLHDVRAVRRWL